MKEDLLNNTNFQKENILDIKKEISYYLFFWPWFIGFIAACLIGAFLYLRYEKRIYKTTAQIQIKKGESDPSSFLTGGMDLFGFDKINTANDIALMKSQYILPRISESGEENT